MHHVAARGAASDAFLAADGTPGAAAAAARFVAVVAFGRNSEASGFFLGPVVDVADPVDDRLAADPAELRAVAAVTLPVDLRLAAAPADGRAAAAIAFGLGRSVRHIAQDRNGASAPPW